MIPQRGEIWVINLDPTMGSELKKTRPCIVISTSKHNEYAGTITIIPITSGEVKYPSFQIALDQNAGLDHSSHLELPQIRVADKQRLVKKLGDLPPAIFKEIFLKLNCYLGFLPMLEQR